MRRRRLINREEREAQAGRAPRNRTLALTAAERAFYRRRLVTLDGPAGLAAVRNKVIHQDLFAALPLLPAAFADLVFVDPPYNLSKNFGAANFRRRRADDYGAWLDAWLPGVKRLMKPAASIYICADWRSSGVVQKVCEKYFVVRNRITFEREKGRGALRNWKNNAEDIWFATASDEYYFDAAAVKTKRRVLAPYTEGGAPKGWREEESGRFRLTHPSNLWTDITIPYWSMPENTPHPTQKPEKLLAKIILASSRPGDCAFDPFAGAGTAAVVARKLGRDFLVVELDEEYCLYAAKRLALALHDATIQGYEGGVFWERNALRPATERRNRRT